MLIDDGKTYDFGMIADSDKSHVYPFNVASAISHDRPGKPTGLNATAGNVTNGFPTVTLRWTAPSTDGGHAITGYKVQFMNSQSVTWTTLIHSDTVTSYTVTFLEPGTLFNFRVNATNSEGTGIASDVFSATTHDVPAAPKLTAYPASGQVRLVWTVPSSGLPITGYTIEYKPSLSTDWTAVNHSTTSYTVSGLTDGTSYDFRVSATNSVGPGDKSSKTTVTPSLMPLDATPGNTRVGLTWTDSTNNGDTTGYNVMYKLSSASDWTKFKTVASSANSEIVTGLKNGSEYNFRIVQVVSSGAAESSAIATATPIKGGNSNDDWKRKPTFGISEGTLKRIVDCGFVMDNICRDILDYHVDYDRKTINTNSRHDFALKAYGVDGIKYMIIGFGMPHVGSPINDAEAYIKVSFDRNFGNRNNLYSVSEVTYMNEDNVIGDDARISVDNVPCNDIFTLLCLELHIDNLLFRESFFSEPFVVHAVDHKHRSTTHYMNEGLQVIGESMNPPPTINHGIYNPGNQYDAIPVQLVRVDKLADIWIDNLDRTWTRDTQKWIILEDIIRIPTVDAKTESLSRHHSYLDELIMLEEAKSVLIWNSESIQGQLPDYFTYDYPVSFANKLANPEVQGILKEQEQRALDYLASLYHIYED